VTAYKIVGEKGAEGLSALRVSASSKGMRVGNESLIANFSIEDFPFGFQPVVKRMALTATPLEIQFIGAAVDRHM
jgi:hypothetical protein